jgi:hypothetical protein
MPTERVPVQSARERETLHFTHNMYLLDTERNTFSRKI